MGSLKGTFLLSIHVELAWGFVGVLKIDERRLQAVARVREILDPLLKLIEAYQIPVTWAILGHVFLDHCKSKGLPHQDMPRPNYRWFEGDWYKYDPCSNVRSNPHWYGKDIVEKILGFARCSAIEQEIGCHSFSHQVFGDPGCGEELARAEISKCLEIMKDEGLRPKTFVFPVNSVGHIGMLRAKDFTAFYGSVPLFVGRSSLEKSTVNVFRRYVSLGTEFLSYYLLLPPPVGAPKQVLPGLWEIPSSMCFNKKRKVPMSLVVSKAKKGIKRAVSERKCFGMFTHLHNFGEDPSTLLTTFEDVLAYADDARRRGGLQILTTEEFVNTLETRHRGD